METRAAVKALALGLGQGLIVGFLDLLAFEDLLNGLGVAGRM
jgi:hypothetical protein